MLPNNICLICCQISCQISCQIICCQICCHNFETYSPLSVRQISANLSITGHSTKYVFVFIKYIQNTDKMLLFTTSFKNLTKFRSFTITILSQFKIRSLSQFKIHNYKFSTIHKFTITSLQILHWSSRSISSAREDIGTSILLNIRKLFSMNIQ